jgi:anti-anti-sigma factor
MLDIDVSDHDEVLVVALKGSLNSSTADDLDRRLAVTIQAETKRLLFDLEGLEFVSSAGLRVFLMADKRLKKQGGEARYCSLNENIQNLFDLTGLRAHSGIFPTRAAALTGFKDPKK